MKITPIDLKNQRKFFHFLETRIKKFNEKAINFNVFSVERLIF